MKKLMDNYLLMDAAGEGNSGGGGTGTILTSSQGGGTTNSTGGSGTGQPASAQGAQASGNNGAAGGSQGTANTNWRSALPSELQAEPSLQTFTDVTALAKSFVHAQRAIGADKLVVPGKHATDEDWKQVFTKLGLPAEVKDYTVKMKEDASIDKDFIEKFKTASHAAGILPGQAQKLADWFQEVNSTSAEQIQKERQQKIEQEISALKSEWGAAYDKNIGAAAQVIREAGDKELIEYLDKTGLGNDTRLIKLLAKVGEKFLGEDKLLGGNQEFKGKYTPSQALQEANKIMGNFDHPYHKKEHPNHNAAVQEVKELFEMAHPSTGPKKV